MTPQEELAALRRLAELEAKAGGERAPAKRDDPTEGMSRFDKLIVGAGRGFTDLGQGAKQLALNAGAKLGIADQSTADDYNRRVANEAQLFDEGLGDSGWATAGRIGAQVLATAPVSSVGMGLRGANAVRTAMKVGGVGAATGAGTAALNPVTDGDFWSGKGKQVAIGTAAGGLLSAGGSGVASALQRGVNAPRQLANALVSPQAPAGEPAGKLTQLVTGSAAGIRRGDRVAQTTGIDLSPGQRSGGKAMTMLENVARGSVWTRDRMFQGDQQRARQMLNTIRRTSREISGESVSPEAFATNLQGTVKTMVGDLATARSKFGREAYGAVEKAAGGAKIVQTNGTLDAIAGVVDEFKGVQGADAQAIAAQAERFFNQLGGDGAISPGLAMRQLQAWEQASRTGTGLFEGVQNRSTAKTVAGKLARALQDDLDATANSAGGTLGESLRAANKGWREYSQQIDAVEASALGRIVGDDFVDSVAGVGFNQVSPEKVWQRMDSLAPSELEAVKTYLTRAKPELWAQYQKLTLDRARDVARQSAPSSGSRTLGIDPGAFVKALGGSSGQKAVDMKRRMAVIFGGTPQEGRVMDLMEAGRRMADSTGRNFSGTAGASEVMAMPGLLGKAAQGAQAAAGAIGPLYGLQKVAQKAGMPISQRAPMPMYQMGALGQFLSRAPATAGASQLPPWLLQQNDQAGRPPGR